MKKIPNYPNYSITKTGKVFSHYMNKFKKLQTHKQGYLMVTLKNKTTRKTFSVHRLVLLTYLGKSNLDVNHINGIKNDNRLENLEYTTASDNLKHAYRLGLICLKGENHHLSKLTEDQVKEIKLLLSLGVKNRELAIKYNVSDSTICNIKYSRKWTHIKENL